MRATQRGTDVTGLPERVVEVRDTVASLPPRRHASNGHSKRGKGLGRNVRNGAGDAVVLHMTKSP